MTGYLANLAYLCLGEVTAGGSPSRATGMPFDRLFGTVIVERVIDVLSLAACMLGTALLNANGLVDFSTTTFSDRSARSCRGFSVSVRGDACRRHALHHLVEGRSRAAGTLKAGFRQRLTGMLQASRRILFRTQAGSSVGIFSSYGADWGDVLPDVIHPFLRATRNRSAWGPAAGFVLSWSSAGWGCRRLRTGEALALITCWFAD